MKIEVMTLFPEIVTAALGLSIPMRAQAAGVLLLKTCQLRDFAADKHGTVDDKPHGGGPGMILRVDIADRAFRSLDRHHQAHRVMLTPSGEQLNQPMLEKLAKYDRIIILCGRYEGFDARIDKYIDQKISVGPYVLSGGEPAAIILVDAISRLLPGVLGNEASLVEETHTDSRQEYPQYTRPDEYDGQSVPPILKTGHHQQIEDWRRAQQSPLN
ncbi:MAG: tRNA (guanosine(37)-N1)-methyltransferase TrmD [Patescibacteria group bacterium]